MSDLTRLERLRALADDLEAAFAGASIGVKAQLAAQYRATLAEIDALGGAAPAEGAQVTGVDEVRARREARERSA